MTLFALSFGLLVLSGSNSDSPPACQEDDAICLRRSMLYYYEKSRSLEQQLAGAKKLAEIDAQQIAVLTEQTTSLQRAMTATNQYLADTAPVQPWWMSPHLWSAVGVVSGIGLTLAVGAIWSQALRQ